MDALNTHSKGVRLIAAERRRQEAEEGKTWADDAAYVDKDLVRAAESYVLAVLDPQWWAPSTGNVPAGWPWHAKWFKPSDDPVRNLVKAGALIAAEIDRLRIAQQSACAPAIASRP